MSAQISFFSAIDNSKISGDRLHCLGRISEGYLNFRKVSYVATRVDSNGMIRLTEETTKKETAYLMTALKIVSFATIVFPLLMAAAKMIYRLSNRLISENIVDGTLIRKLPIDLIENILGRVDPKTLHEMVPDGKMALGRDPQDKLARALKIVYQKQKLEHILHNIDYFREHHIGSHNEYYSLSLGVAPDKKIMEKRGEDYYTGLMGDQNSYPRTTVNLRIRTEHWDANEMPFVFTENIIDDPKYEEIKAIQTYLAPHLDLLNRLARGAYQLAKEVAIREGDITTNFVPSYAVSIFRDTLNYPVSMLLDAAERAE